MSMKERCEILRRVGDLILSRKEELAQAETLDTGKPITESLTGDIPRSAQNFHFFSDFAQSMSDEVYTSAPGEKHIVSREPLGVVGLITPWNLPLYLATWKIAPCLAMGNTCVLKPAEWTPYTAFLLADIVSLAGLPKGVLNIVHGLGADSAGEALTRHPDVRAISFTGETGTGRAIMGAAAATSRKFPLSLAAKVQPLFLPTQTLMRLLKQLCGRLIAIRDRFVWLVRACLWKKASRSKWYDKLIGTRQVHSRRRSNQRHDSNGRA